MPSSISPTTLQTIQCPLSAFCACLFVSLASFTSSRSPTSSTAPQPLPFWTSLQLFRKHNYLTLASLLGFHRLASLCKTWNSQLPYRWRFSFSTFQKKTSTMNFCTSKRCIFLVPQLTLGRWGIWWRLWRTLPFFSTVPCKIDLPPRSDRKSRDLGWV